VDLTGGAGSERLGAAATEVAEEESAGVGLTQTSNRASSPTKGASERRRPDAKLITIRAKGEYRMTGGGAKLQTTTIRSRAD